MRALLSVYDKAGIVELAQQLHDLGVDLVSSGGTADVIEAAGIPVTRVADLTGYPAMLSHRVATLHPKIHGGLLADRDNPEHLAEVERYEIPLIDLLVVNLYPFTSEPSIKQIDVGGPAMIRAGAKNYAFVGVVTDPADYDVVVSEIKLFGNLMLSSQQRLELARKAFAHTAEYDTAIAAWFQDVTIDSDVGSST